MTIDIHFSNNVLQSDAKRLINQIWKLIPMRENAEDWQNQVITLVEEIYGLDALINELDLLIILSKLRGLLCEECLNDFMLFRKTVFKCISLLAKAVPNSND